MSDNSQNALVQDRKAINRLAQRLAGKTESVKDDTELNAVVTSAQEASANKISDSAKNSDFVSDINSATWKNPTDVLRSCYQRNMAALFKYQPSIYKAFCSYRSSKPMEIVYTKSGVPDIYFNNNNELFYKVDDPIALCRSKVDDALKNNTFKLLTYSKVKDEVGHIQQRYANEMAEYQKNNIVSDSKMLLTSSCPNAIIIGVGLGYHIGILYEKIEIGNLILIEPDADLFYASLYTFDWAGFLDFVFKEHRGLYIMVGQNKDEVFNDLNNFYENHGFMLSGFMWSMIHYNSAETNAIASQLSIDYERVYSNKGFLDSFYFNISHAGYLVSHHARFLRNDVDLPENIRDIPLCVVANGPSLSQDLPFLRKIQDKVLIMACGSALETLYNAGIQPFFFASLERLRIVAESLSIIPDQDYVKSTILLSTDVCHPETFSMFKDTALFTKFDEVFYYMAKIRHPEIYKNILGASRINPLVGNFGVTAAGLLRFKNVYLFGIDNGTKRKGVIHPQESLLYKNSVKRQQERALTSNQDKKEPDSYVLNELEYVVPGNFGGDVYASLLYKNSLSRMELSVKRNKETNYYNCSDGAKINGALALHSADLFDSWQQRPDVDFTSIRNFIKNEQTIDLNLTEQDVDEIVDHKSFYEVVDKIREFLVERKRPSKRLDYVMMMQEACEFLQQLSDRNHLFAVVTLNSSLNFYFVMIINALYLTADEAQAIEHAEKHMGWVIDFLDDARKLYQYVPKYYGNEHRKFFVDNKVGFDHPDSIAPVFEEPCPFVTQEDRDRYPLRKFVKRYE